MKKFQLLISIIILAGTMVSLHSQKIDHFYVEMPEILNPVINKKQRLELLEYFKAGMGDSIENRFGKQTYLADMDTIHNHILVKNTDISLFEMKMIQSGNDTIIGLIQTVCTPICQSVINFYDTRWNKYPGITFNFPEAKEWIDKDKVQNPELTIVDINNLFGTSFISLSFDPEKTRFWQEITALNSWIKMNRKKFLHS